MDWGNALMAAIIFGPLTAAAALTGVVMYRMIFKSTLDPEYAEKEKEHQIKEKAWTLPLLVLISLTLALYKIRVLDAAVFALVMLPLLIVTLFILILRHHQEKTQIAFLDIFRHPLKNIGLFLLFWLLAAAWTAFTGLLAITSL